MHAAIENRTGISFIDFVKKKWNEKNLWRDIAEKIGIVPNLMNTQSNIKMLLYFVHLIVLCMVHTPTHVTTRGDFFIFQKKEKKQKFPHCYVRCLFWREILVTSFQNAIDSKCFQFIFFFVFFSFLSIRANVRMSKLIHEFEYFNSPVWLLLYVHKIFYAFFLKNFFNSNNRQFLLFRHLHLHFISFSTFLLSYNIFSCYGHQKMKCIPTQI